LRLGIIGFQVDIVSKFFLDGFVNAPSIFGGVGGAGAEKLAVEVEEVA
jgi:hypothetical protein